MLFIAIKTVTISKVTETLNINKHEMTMTFKFSQ